MNNRALTGRDATGRKLWLGAGEAPKLPHPAVLESGAARTPHLTNSELDSANSASHGYRRPADLLTVVEGLRAQVKGTLPASKPACPTVVSCTLPRSTKADALRREAKAWEAKLRHTRGQQAAGWAAQLAEAELSSWSHWELERTALGHRDHTHRNLDRVVGQDESGNDLTHHEVLGDRRWAEELAAEELREVLLLHLTAKEVEALEREAAGLPQVTRSNRDTLARAQRKAQAALRG